MRVLDEAFVPTRLMLLKFVCNLFAPTDFKLNAKLLSADRKGGICPRDVVTNLLIETLLASNVQLRQASALLAFNIGLTATQIKKQYLFDESWCSELIAAVSNAIENESQQSNDETGFFA